MAITIFDVAEKASCFIKTVSRVINNEPHVKPKLQDRVRSAIEKLDYSPNIAALRLAQKRAYTICYFLHASGSFQSALISKGLDIRYKGDYEILIQTYYPSFSRSRKRIRQLINQH